MKFYKYLLVLGCFLCTAQISAQHTPKTMIYFYTSPASESVIINDLRLMSGNEAMLDTGMNHIRLWAPNHYILDTLLYVKAGQPIDFIYNFTALPGYEEHLRLSSRYFNKKAVNFYTPVIATGALITTMGLTYLSAQNRYDEANALWSEYLYEDNDLAGKFSEFEAARDSYRNQIRSFYIQSGALLISGYFLYRGIRWIQENKKPKYKGDKDPFLQFDRAYVFSSSAQRGNSTIQASLIFTLN